MKTPPMRVRDLVQAAKAAAAKAYCPYSNFPVGAAVLTDSGKIFAAPNVENASYSVTLCAERGAAGQAIAAGERGITALALYTKTATPSTPCGMCRQFLSEFNPSMEVFCAADGEEVTTSTLDALLPLGFKMDPAPR